MVTWKESTVIMTEEGDFLGGEFYVEGVSSCCGGGDFRVVISDGDGYEHVKETGRKGDTVSLNFDPPIHLKGIRLKELTGKISQVRIYVS